MSAARRRVVVLLAALAAAMVATCVAPAGGVVLHWSADEAERWRVLPVLYGVITLVAVPVLGYVIASLRQDPDADATRGLRGVAAVAVAFIAFAATQRLEQDALLLSPATALVLGLVCYSATSRSTRG